jgi:hypothetical protein
VWGLGSATRARRPEATTDLKPVLVDLEAIVRAILSSGSLPAKPCSELLGIDGGDYIEQPRLGELDVWPIWGDWADERLAIGSHLVTQKATSGRSFKGKPSGTTRLIWPKARSVPFTHSMSCGWM